MSRELLAAAAPRPWFHIGWEIARPEVDIVRWAYADMPPAEWPDADERANPNLRLIVAAVNEYEALLDIVSVAQRAVVDIERRLGGDASINAPFDEDLAEGRVALIDALANLAAVRRAES